MSKIPAPEEQQDEARQHDHLDPDVLHQVVVETPPALDRGDDGGEVVVGEDHLRGVLGDLGPGDPHGDADVGPRQRRCVVDTVAGHGDDVPLLLEQADEPHLVLRCDPGHDADLAHAGPGAARRERRELGAREGPPFDAELARRWRPPSWRGRR